MLPPHSESKYTEFIQGLTLSLDLCHHCHRSVEGKMSMGGSQAPVSDVNYDSCDSVDFAAFDNNDDDIDGDGGGNVVLGMVLRPSMIWKG